MSREAVPSAVSIRERPLLILVGVTGVGKSTTLAALANLVPQLHMLPDRRTLTDERIIPQVQAWDDEPAAPVTDRAKRFDYTRRYRQQHPGGMAHALAQLTVDAYKVDARKDDVQESDVQKSEGAHGGSGNDNGTGDGDGDPILCFDGLRGAAEVTYAARELPNARFVVLDAPDLVRVRRLTRRQDAFDRIQIDQNYQGDQRQADTSSPDLAQVPGIEGVFSRDDLVQMARWVQTGEVAEADLWAKLAIVIAERQNYDPSAAIDALTRLAPDRTLVVDTTQLTPAQVATQIADFLPADAKPADTKLIDAKPTDTKHSDLKRAGSETNGPIPNPQSPNSQSPNSPTIAQVETIPFRLPLHEPLAWGKSSRMDDVTHVLVRVTLSDGSQGVAESPPRPTIYGETVESIQAITAQELAPRLLGEAVSLARLPALHARLAQVKNNNAARAAVDMALWDALAASQGVPLAHLLGATQSRLRVSYILGISDEEATMAEAERVVAQGVRVLKVKVGRDWDGDLARIDRLRQVLGPEVDLYADANECFDVENAARRLAILAERGLLYCEEPLPVEQLQARAALRQSGHLPIIGDDSCFTRRDLQRELALDTFDVLNIKTARTGYTESTQMVEAAQAAGKGIMVGSQASAGLGTVRAALFTARPGIVHPSELSFFLKLKEDLLTHPLTLTNGYLQMDQVRQARLDPDRLADAEVST